MAMLGAGAPHVPPKKEAKVGLVFPSHSGPEHTAGVNALAQDPSGTVLWTGGRDGVVNGWQVREGRTTHVATLEEHVDWVNALALGGIGGGLLLSGSSDGTVRVWDAAAEVRLAREAVRVAEEAEAEAETGTGEGEEKGGARGADEGAAAEGAVSRGADSGPTPWSARGHGGTRSALLTLVGHGDYVTSLAAPLKLPHRLASGGLRGEVFLWDLERRTLETAIGPEGLPAPLPGPPSPPSPRARARAASPNPPAAAAAAASIPTAPSRPHTYLRTPCDALNASVYALACDARGATLAAGLADGVVRILDARSGRRALALRGHSDVVRGLALSADGRSVLSAASDGALKLWDLRAARCVAGATPHAGPAWALLADSDARGATTGGRDGTVVRTRLEASAGGGSGGGGDGPRDGEPGDAGDSPPWRRRRGGPMPAGTAELLARARAPVRALLRCARDPGSLWVATTSPDVERFDRVLPARTRRVARKETELRSSGSLAPTVVGVPGLALEEGQAEVARVPFSTEGLGAPGGKAVPPPPAAPTLPRPAMATLERSTSSLSASSSSSSSSWTSLEGWSTEGEDESAASDSSAGPPAGRTLPPLRAPTSSSAADPLASACSPRLWLPDAAVSALPESRPRRSSSDLVGLVGGASPTPSPLARAARPSSPRPPTRGRPLSPPPPLRPAASLPALASGHGHHHHGHHSQQHPQVAAAGGGRAPSPTSTSPGRRAALPPWAFSARHLTSLRARAARCDGQAYPRRARATAPSATIRGSPPVTRADPLTDRRRVLVRDAAGGGALVDITTGTVLAEYAPGADLAAIERDLFDPAESFPAWFSPDVRLGRVGAVLSTPQAFSAEAYLADLGDPSAPADAKINLGLALLAGLFGAWADTQEQAWDKEHSAAVGGHGTADAPDDPSEPAGAAASGGTPARDSNGDATASSEPGATAGSHGTGNADDAGAAAVASPSGSAAPQALRSPAHPLAGGRGAALAGQGRQSPVRAASRVASAAPAAPDAPASPERPFRRPKQAFDLGAAAPSVLVLDGEGIPWRRSAARLGEPLPAGAAVPAWVQDAVLRSRYPLPRELKTGFHLVPAEGSGLPSLLQPRLHAPRVLSVAKVAEYLVRRLREVGVDVRQEPLLFHPERLPIPRPTPALTAATPPSAGPRGAGPGAAGTRAALADARPASPASPARAPPPPSTPGSRAGSLAGSQPPSPTRWAASPPAHLLPAPPSPLPNPDAPALFLACRGMAVPWDFSLSAVRQWIWRRSDDVILEYSIRTSTTKIRMPSIQPPAK